jgi:hypothetical protein
MYVWVRNSYSESVSIIFSLSQWPRGLRHEMSLPSRTPGWWVWIPLKAQMYVCVYSVFVYVCVYMIGEGLIRPLHCDHFWSIVLPLLINPLLIPHFDWSAGLYLWGRHRSHRVPWKTVPGGDILDELKPHSHIGHVWLIHLLLGTFHKWDHSSIPIWRNVPLDDSVLCIVPLSILVGPCSTLSGPLFFWQKVLV